MRRTATRLRLVPTPADPTYGCGLRIAAALGVAWLAVYGALGLRYPGASWLSNGLYFVPIVLAFALTVRAARRCAENDRWFWRLTLGYVGLSLIGEIAYVEEAYRGAGSPNLSDVAYLAAYVPMTLTVIAVAGRDGWRRNTISAVVDSFVVTAALGYFAFANLLDPSLATGSVLSLSVLAAYPLWDVLIVLLVCLVSLALGRRLPLSHKLIMASFLTTSVSDIAFTYASLHGGYTQGSVSDLGWQAEGVLVCLGALIAVKPPAGVWKQRARTFDVGIWLVIGSVALIFAGTAKDALDAGVQTSAIIAAIVGIGVLAIRTLTAEREIRRAHRREQSRANDLEAVVARRTRRLEETVAALDRSQREMVRRLGHAIHLRSEETGAHVDRLAAACGLVARELGLDEHTCELIEVASPLHDIGKIAVPDLVLQKPGMLTADERAVIQRHAEDGFRMLEGSDQKLLQIAAEIARCHHERFDGTGYPQGLRGAEIPLAARIVSVCDVFDALTSDRVYRPALPLRRVIKMLREGAGSQFDPQVVAAFLTVLPQVLAVNAGFAERESAAA